MAHRITRMFAPAFAVALLLPAAASAQQARATLTLEEAISLARRNNPTFRATANDGATADWQVREAYSQFLPSFTASNTFSYQASGTPQAFGAFTAEDLGLGNTPEVYSSAYRLGLQMGLSGATFFNITQARAAQRATDARIEAAAYTLASDVTRQYLAARRAFDGVKIAQSAMESTEQALRLAQARFDVGDATRLDVSQAEVDHGRAEVGLLQAESLYQTEQLRLMQQIGVEIDRELELTSEFEVFEPKWTLPELESRAIESHPQMVSLRASESAARAAARASWTQYMPQLFLNAGWNGFVRRTGTDQYQLQQARNSAENRIANCEFQNHLAAGLSNGLPNYPRDCSTLALTSDQEARALAANSAFPFNYAANPMTVSLTVSLPIWDGFTRERQLQTARVAADDATYQRRDEELNRRTQVATNLLALQTAFRTVAIEERNVDRAGEALELARESYRLGAGSILELTQAQEQKVRADQAHLAAVYTFHESLAALEAAVGRQLR